MRFVLTIVVTLVIGLTALVSHGAENSFSEACTRMSPENRTILYPSSRQICILKGMPAQWDIADLAELAVACEKEKSGIYSRIIADLDQSNGKPAINVTCWPGAVK